MLKNLRLYYVIVILPFVLLLGGGAAFFNAIKLTITRNPHPQINFVIFLIIVVGGTLISMTAHHLIREAKLLVQYSNAVRDKMELAALQAMTGGFIGDIACLLHMISSSTGRSISHQEQAAIEHELNNTRARLTRRNSLPQYLSGLLVGMGLLGTFIGLLATLSDISTLISSFAELDMNNVSPIAVFRVMIERMKAPMQSMGIAFSASMYGLLGSIILGLMMVGLRRLQGDIISLLGSEVARHIEVALSHESGVAPVESGAAPAGGDAKALHRIEARLAESARGQQRLLAAEIDDFQKQRADMIRTIAEQTEASNAFRSELQQLGRQLAAVLAILEKGSSSTAAQISDLTVALTADARRIEERLAETARTEQRLLAAEVEDFQKQRADMQRTIAEQTEASISFRSELQQLGRQLGDVLNSLQKGSGETSSQLSELIVHLAADAKESHRLLAMQIDEQKQLRDALESHIKSSGQI